MDARGANILMQKEIKSEFEFNIKVLKKIKNHPSIACVVNAAQRVNFCILKKDFKEVRRGEKNTLRKGK